MSPSDFQSISYSYTVVHKQGHDAVMRFLAHQLSVKISQRSQDGCRGIMEEKCIHPGRRNLWNVPSPEAVKAKNISKGAICKFSNDQRNQKAWAQSKKVAMK